MHAGDGDAVFEAHELGEHLGTLDYGDFAGPGFFDLRIVIADGGAGDYDCGVTDVAALVALVDGGSQLRETVGDGAAAQVGAGDAHAHGQQNLGDAAHADSADANEVNVLLLDEHGQRARLPFWALILRSVLSKVSPSETS